VIPTNFPGWARIALGIAAGVLTFFLSGGVDLHVSEETRGLLSALVGALAAYGFVPPKPGSVVLPVQVRLVLSLAVPLAVYAVNVWIHDGTLRGVIAGIITLLGSYFIIPLQAQANPA
jgi:hypothetical protein